MSDSRHPPYNFLIQSVQALKEINSKNVILSLPLPRAHFEWLELEEIATHRHAVLLQPTLTQSRMNLVWGIEQS